jgi:hypothetical protein
VRSISKRVAVLCLLLTILSALAFAAHHHSNNSESAKCSACVAAHSTVPRAAAPIHRAVFTPVFTLKPGPVPVKERFVAFALSVRPPPAA